jgi:hypothetical protein
MVQFYHYQRTLSSFGQRLSQIHVQKELSVNVHNIFVLIEKAIIVLTSIEHLNSELNKIESREDYKL